MERLQFPGKIRKRGCSSSASSSSSSVIQNYKFKRAILIGKQHRGGGSTTPLPTWRLLGTTTTTHSPAASGLRGTDSPRSRNKNEQQPLVSARKLAATLWEMNEIPSSSSPTERFNNNNSKEQSRKLRKDKSVSNNNINNNRSVRSGSLPPHLSDPSHSPVSERIDRPGTGNRHGRTSSISRGLRPPEHTVNILDSMSNASLMEVETRSRAQTPSQSTVGGKTRLKDVSNALTTSKELLRIINRMWGHDERPSSSMSLISALHAELERARLLVNNLIQEQRSDRSEINYLMKCFAEEKASWERKVEAAIESVAGEVDVERKLRKRFESLNKKLGKELAETKSTLIKVVKELEVEKSARIEVEQVCDELARDITDDKAEVEKEREMMQLADVLREERVQMKLTEAKYQLEEKNAAVDKLRNQLEVFLGPTKASGSLNQLNDEEIVAGLIRARISDDGEICEEDSAESDLHSIELNMDSINKSYKWAHPGGARKAIEEDRRKSVSSKPPRRSTTLQRSISDFSELDKQLDKQAQGKAYVDELLSYKLVKDNFLSSGSKLESPRYYYNSPTRSSRDLLNATQDRPPMVLGKSRLSDLRRLKQ
ncbi:hypothetical protein ACFE04_001516 [Oxalis oulophora]